ncbi:MULTISPECIES: hypothetical protein [Deinococcus]|uniref:Uncharacterized protein n=1 Tax=Deinococcus rufus TaxID=2136097 RepID=A0ABV7Z3E7_9DEIO|nr:hypothetical protein [Deinococcus sp. AB2017081]WQE96000.1 hypothetical protein U2P90_03670 [Deinococcus sp. AB2017081]
MVTQEYQLLRVVNGFTHFACVSVRFRLGLGMHVVPVLPEHPDTGAGEINASLEPEWVAAAIQGCRDGLALGQAAVEDGGKLVEVLRVVGTPLDTCPADVRLTACMATLLALDPERTLPQYALQFGEWFVEAFA